eukprot:TRINITY_DN14356_c0_g1_i2.p3 TRINITY_DN14356_c0_g1~~TRINITY_DN14356_c0_g1_i2.p3  ORF type:complete len:110 (+),score=15.60 TRINITY_DN14356_c0_g1_i2:138-467(+)
MQKAPDPNRQQRRSRNDQDGRDFHCGCGKSYLSYTALYTHVKVKHRGKTPEGTKIVHASSNPSKKERPSKSARKSVEPMYSALIPLLPMYSALIPVSYTHLTLPTICSV